MFTIPVCTAIRFPSCAAKDALFYTRSLLGKQESTRDQIGPTSQAPRLVSSPCACHRGTDRFFRNPLGSLRLHAIISIMDKKTKFNIWYVFIALWGVVLLHGLWVQMTQQIEEIPYSQFQTYLAEGRIEEIRISPNYIQGKLKDPEKGHPQQFVTVRVEPELADKLAAYQVKFAGEIENT